CRTPRSRSGFWHTLRRRRVGWCADALSARGIGPAASSLSRVMTSLTSDATPQHPLRLSVLDLIPVRSNQSSADAVAATIELARVADELGYERCWVAEHHNMPAVAPTNPAVLIRILGANTTRIRLGS